MRKILIVDDSAFQRKHIVSKVVALGFTADVAANGQVALQKVTETIYDVLITDLHMPEMSGYELLAQLQKMSSKVPVIVASADIQPETVLAVKNLGAAGFITKPVVDDQLKEVLNGVLGNITSATG